VTTGGPNARIAVFMTQLVSWVKTDEGRLNSVGPIELCIVVLEARVLLTFSVRSSSTVKAITALSTRLSGLEGLLAGHQANVTRAQGTSPPAASVPSPQNLSITFGDPAQQTQLPLLQANPEQDTSGISMELGNNDLSSYMSQQPDYWNNLDEGAEIMDWSQMELHFRRGNEDYPQHSDPQYPTSAENQMGDAQSVSRPSNSLGTMNMDGSSVALPQPTSITSYTKSTNNLSDGGGVADPVVETEVTQFLTTRFGRLQYAEDGQIRYFGSTSNMHMFPNGLQSMFQPVVRTLRDHGETSLKAHNLKWPGDPLYEEHLTNLFFAWHNPFLKEVDRKVYQREKEVYYSGKETSLFSPTLENAM
jgi:hypothetical protein